MATEQPLSDLAATIGEAIRTTLADFSKYWPALPQDKIYEHELQAFAARLLIQNGISCAREVSFRDWGGHGSLHFDWVLGDRPRTPLELKVIRDGNRADNFWADVRKVGECQPDLSNNKARPVCVALVAECGGNTPKDYLFLQGDYARYSKLNFPSLELEFSNPWQAGKSDWKWFLALARHGNSR